MITLTIYGSYFYRKRYNIYFQKAKNTYRSFKFQMKLIEIKEFRVTKIVNEVRTCTNLSEALPSKLMCIWSAMVQKFHMIKLI